MPTFAVIMPAAGKSSRFKDRHYKKPFANLNNRAVWLHAAEKFFNRDDVKQFILILAEEDREEFQMKFGANVMIHGVEVVVGGAERADSIQNAISKLRDDVDYVAIHDAARPCIANEWIDAVFQEATKSGAAILAIPVAGTLKRSANGRTIDETVARDNLWEAQTPQVFRRDLLLKAYAERKDFAATDDAQLVERLGHPVSIVPGSPINFKITTKEDLRLAGHAINALPKPRLEGPAHPFADDRWR
ncbi:MAG: 2-C-methyl-D-erythritol 4-phosphate cytidylyltransferase [Pirellulales bacterium]